jgi:hypothetical protein
MANHANVLESHLHDLIHDTLPLDLVGVSFPGDPDDLMTLEELIAFSPQVCNFTVEPFDESRYSSFLQYLKHPDCAIGYVRIEKIVVESCIPIFGKLIRDCDSICRVDAKDDIQNVLVFKQLSGFKGILCVDVFEFDLSETEFQDCISVPLATACAFAFRFSIIDEHGQNIPRGNEYFGGLKVVEAVSSNSNLKVLDLADVVTTSAQRRNLAEMIRRNRSLDVLEVYSPLLSAFHWKKSRLG